MLFGVGEKSLFQKIVEGDKDLVSCAVRFESVGETSDTIEQCGNKAMALLFGGKATEDLAKLRHKVLRKKVASGDKFCYSRTATPDCVSDEIPLIEVLLSNQSLVRPGERPPCNGLGLEA